MIDASHWSLRGPVRSLRSEVAEWDAARGDWADSRFFQSVVFDGEGRVLQLDQRGKADTIFRTTLHYDDCGRLREMHGGTAGDPEQHRTIYTYDDDGRLTGIIHAAPEGTESAVQASTFDDRGRRTTVQYLPPETIGVMSAYSVEGSDVGYAAPGAATETTRYDEQGRSVEALFHDAGGELVRRVVLTRDDQGRVVHEEAHMLGHFGLPDETPDMPAADRDRLQAFAARAFGTLRTDYDYDRHGRLARQTQQMGILGEARTTYDYDERGNRVAQREVRVNREVRLDDQGNPAPGEDSTRIHDSRFEYRYDAHGNWTERTVSARFREDAEFAPSNTERRTIEYRQA